MATRTQPDTPTQARSELILRGEGVETRSIPLSDSTLIIGRTARADIHLDHASVSRRHAELMRDPFGRWWVRDLNSHNGTRVNGSAIQHRALSPGDVIEIASFQMELLTPEPADPTEPIEASAAGVTLSDVGRIERINTLDDGGAAGDQAARPRLDPRRLLSVQSLGPRLLSVEPAAERRRLLCEGLVAPSFGAWHAAILEVDLASPTEPRVVCGPVSGERVAGGTFHVSRGLLRAVASGVQPLIARHGQTGRDTVGLSISPAAAPIAALACPWRISEQRLRLLYAVVPPSHGTPEWLALAALAVEQLKQADQAWAAREQARRHARIERDLEQARDVQMRLVPQDVRLSGAEVAIGFQPCLWVGGDYVDAWSLPDGRVMLAIADVCGKGMQAALITAALHTWMHAGTAGEFDLADLMRGLGRYLEHTLTPGSFVTMTAALFDPASGAIEMVNAGHPPALVGEPGGGVRPLDFAGNLPLGIMDEPLVKMTERLECSRRLLLYTDGLTEARDESSRMLGVDGLADQFARLLAEDDPPVTMASRLTERIRAWQGDRLADDDQTFLLLRRNADG